MHDRFRSGRLIVHAAALFIAAGLFGCATAQSTAPAGPSGQGAAQAATQTEKTVSPGQAQRPVSQGPALTVCCPLPGRMDFCGEPLPLENQEVLERFDKEFTLIVYNHAQVYWWLKHQDRYFPRIVDCIRRLNLPEDLKYVALAESFPALNSTDRRRSVDARYDFDVSPESALQYLGDLYRSFKSWPLALAAYKLGEKRVMEEIRAQGVSDCYKLMLPQDTERYIFKVLAMKVVLSDPTRYGYQLPKR